MKRNLPTKFWLEATLAVIAFGLFVLTLFTREWFEMLTGLEPDGGSGAFEVGLTVALAVIAVVAAWAARREHRLALAPA